MEKLQFNKYGSSTFFFHSVHWLSSFFTPVRIRFRAPENLVWLPNEAQVYPYIQISPQQHTTEDKSEFALQHVLRENHTLAVKLAETFIPQIRSTCIISSNSLRGRELELNITQVLIHYYRGPPNGPIQTLNEYKLLGSNSNSGYLLHIQNKCLQQGQFC